MLMLALMLSLPVEGVLGCLAGAYALT